MSRKNRIVISIVGITIVLLSLIGLTYGYYLTRIYGNTNINSISVSMGKLELVYTDGTNEILTSNKSLTPSTDLTSSGAIGVKDFNVTNNGNNTSYLVIIEDVSVTNVSDGSSTSFISNDFRYTLSCTKKDGSSCDSVDSQTIFPIEGGILIGNKIGEGDIHNYVLTLWYIDTGVNQSQDMGKSFQAKVNINDISRMSNPYGDNSSNLGSNIYDNAQSDSNGTSLENSSLSDVAGEVSIVDEKILSISPDDYGTSYYFRGNVEDNYVNFADMCWRIVRINGDKSIKIILEDQDNICQESDGNWAISLNGIGKAANVNFGFSQYAVGTLTGSDNITTNNNIVYKADYLNPLSSSGAAISTGLFNFQKIFTSDELERLKPGGWCMESSAYSSVLNNKVYEYTLLSDAEKLDRYVSSASFKYNAFIRIYGNSASGYRPTFKCNGSFMNTWKDGVTPMYVGTITADEVVYAGGKYTTDNPSYYLINDEFKKGNDGLIEDVYFWTSSLVEFNGVRDLAFGVTNTGSLYNHLYVYSHMSIRPVVNLISNSEISEGNGLKNSPYIVKN